MLLVGRGGGKFDERAVELGVDQSFWSWNAKFADLDNDGWQDIYVGNGFNFGKEIHSNIFFHNQGGRRGELPLVLRRRGRGMGRRVG